MSAPPRAVDRLWTALAAVVLAALVARLLAGLDRHLDLNTSDALSYVRDGITLSEGSVPDRLLAWAPVSAALYGALHALGWQLLALQDVAGGLVAVAIVLAAFACCRQMIGPTPALLVAALLATTRFVLLREADRLPPPTYLLGAALAFAAAACALRGRHSAGLALAALAALERGEVAAMALVAGVAFAWAGRRRHGARAAWLYAAVGAAALALQQLHRPCVERGWYAFRQHYAGELAARGAGAEGASFTLPDATILRDFPGAASPLQALCANPGAVAEHAWHNLLDWPAMAASVLRPFDGAPGWSTGALALLVVAGLIGVALRRRRLARLLRRRLPVVAAAAAVAVVALLWSMLLAPRSGFQLYVAPLAALVVGAPLRALSGRRGRWWALLLVLVVALAAPSPYARPAVEPLGSRAAARVLARHAWSDGHRLCMLHAKQMVLFAGVGSPLAPVPLHDLLIDRSTPQQVGEAFYGSGANLVLIAPDDLAEAGAAAPFLLAELSSDRWVVLDYVAPTLLYGRADVAPPRRALGDVGGAALAARLRELDAADGAVVDRAIHAIGELGPAARAAVAPLLAVPVDGLPLRRAGVCVALGKLGVDGAAVRQRLRADAADGAAIVRQCARGALRILDAERK